MACQKQLMFQANDDVTSSAGPKFWPVEQQSCLHRLHCDQSKGVNRSMCDLPRLESFFFSMSKLRTAFCKGAAEGTL